MFDKTVLQNGLRIVSSSLPHTRSVSINIFIGAGSRYESDEIAGVSHFLEHMLFKGTKRRPTAREISEEIEGIGGVMNAGTDKELTVYWAKVGDHRFAATLDILADSLLNSLMDPKELEKEREVILEELAMTEDSPADIVNILIDEVVWPHQPLGRDTGGTPDSVRATKRDEIIRYMEQLYVPQNTVVAVAGNVTHAEVVDRVSEYLGNWESRPFGTWYPAQIPDDTPRLRLRSKKTEQAHFCLATPGLSAAHPDRYVLDVLNAILGEGMSSRLFLEIREKRSLCYDVHSYVHHYLDTGSTVVNAGVDPSKLDEALRALALQKFYDVCRRQFRRDEAAFRMILAESRAPGKFLQRCFARRALHLGVDHARLVAEDADVLHFRGNHHPRHPLPVLQGALRAGRDVHGGRGLALDRELRRP